MPAADDGVFPPRMISALLDAAANAAPATLAAQIALPPAAGFHVELEDSKKLIVDALRSFSPELGDKAAAVFGNPERLNIKPADEGKGIMMRVRAGGLEQKDAMSFAGHKDYAMLKEAFPIDHNEKPYSIIDFQYDRRIHALVYLAHELGHAIADDDQQAARRSYRDNPRHMEETQAYLVQSIVTLALADPRNPDKSLAAAAQRHMADELAGQVYAYPLIQAAQEAMDGIAKGQPVNPAIIFKNKFGKGWEKVAQEDWAGKKVFEAMESGDLKTLGEQADRLNHRPTQQLIAAGIIFALQNRDLETKNLVLETALGLRGPKNIGDVLDAAGIKGEDGLKKFMESTVDKVAALSQPAPLPSHAADFKPAPLKVSL